jgi:hypothetical protein
LLRGITVVMGSELDWHGEKWSPGDRLYPEPIVSTGVMVLQVLLMAGIPCYLLQQIMASTAKSGTIAVHLSYS